MEREQRGRPGSLGTGGRLGRMRQIRELGPEGVSAKKSREVGQLRSKDDTWAALNPPGQGGRG